MSDVYLNPIGADLIAEAKANAVKAQEEKPCLTGRFIVALCDSHEALRTRVVELEGEVERLTAQRDDADDKLETCALDYEDTVDERDAALARATASEARERRLRAGLEEIIADTKNWNDPAERAKLAEEILIRWQLMAQRALSETDRPLPGDGNEENE